MGIASCTAILSIVNAVLFRPLPFPDSGRLVQLWERNRHEGIERDRVSPANYSDWRVANSAFEDIAYSPLWHGSRQYNLRGEDSNERISGAVVSSGWFRILRVQPILGRAFTVQEDDGRDPLLAVLGYSLWQRRHGKDRNILGKDILLDSFGLIPVKIVGVMPEGFDHPDHSELWLSSAGYPVPPPHSSVRCCPWLEVIGRLKPGVTPEGASRIMSVIAANIAREYPGKVNPDVAVVPMLDDVVGKVREPLLFLGGAVSLVLLIACANAASLLLSRAAGRRKEIAIRLALGAGRLRIVRQVLAESLVLSLAGGVLGTALVYVSLRLIAGLAAGIIPRIEEVRVDSSVLAIALALSLASGLIFGLAPALHATRLSLNAVLRESGRSAGGRQRLRKLLVSGQVALALMLLAGASLLVRSFLRLTSLDMGFRTQNTFVATLDLSSSTFGPDNRPQQFFQALLDRLEQERGVISAGGISAAPLGEQIGRGETFMIEGRPVFDRAHLPVAPSFSITPGYPRTMGMQLRAGRDFNAADRKESLPVVLVSQTAARRYWPGENPVGKRILFGTPERFEKEREGGVMTWRVVVGIISDVRGAGPHSDARPELYVPFQQWRWNNADLVIRTEGSNTSVARLIRREAAALNPSVVVTNIRTMEQMLSNSIARPKFQMVLLATFSATAVLLAAFGIYGLMAYSVSQRRPEIGIRMAVGATPRQIAEMVVGQGLKLTAVGLLLGLCASVALHGAIRNMIYGISATDPFSLAAALLLIAAVAVTASIVPAFRAARVDPMITLRHD